mmetsp:Transcript_9901/g.26116  ORF Transcript_9901/g.26116 Transcript_9901/m.26116 type:complete len:245 (+) Transcript_9901:1279-2013(+)
MGDKTNSSFKEVALTFSDATAMSAAAGGLPVAGAATGRKSITTSGAGSRPELGLALKNSLVRRFKLENFPVNAAVRKLWNGTGSLSFVGQSRACSSALMCPSPAAKMRSNVLRCGPSRHHVPRGSNMQNTTRIRSSTISVRALCCSGSNATMTAYATKNWNRVTPTAPPAMARKHPDAACRVRDQRLVACRSKAPLRTVASRCSLRVMNSLKTVSRFVLSKPIAWMASLSCLNMPSSIGDAGSG